MVGHQYNDWQALARWPMSAPVYYRGGNGLKPMAGEVKVDPATGLLRTTHGISVWDRPDGLERFGGAYALSQVPAELTIIQRGRNLHHFEVVPAFPMPQAEYEDALSKIVLVAV